jgi:microcystin-dependent protein
MSTPYIALIQMFSFNFAPKGYALCSGQTLPINQNQALFSIIGTMYGGNGQTNFMLPDLRSRVPLHQGNGFIVGQKGGTETVTLTIPTLAAHNHSIQTDATTAGASNSNTPASNTVIGQSAGAAAPGGPFVVSMYGDAAAGPTLNPAAIGNTGGSQAHENRMPYLAINYSIALQGVFPSQN